MPRETPGPSPDQRSLRERAKQHQLQEKAIERHCCQLLLDAANTYPLYDFAAKCMQAGMSESELQKLCQSPLLALLSDTVKVAVCNAYRDLERGLDPRKKPVRLSERRRRKSAKPSQP